MAEVLTQEDNLRAATAANQAPTAAAPEDPGATPPMLLTQLADITDGSQSTARISHLGIPVGARLSTSAQRLLARDNAPLPTDHRSVFTEPTRRADSRREARAQALRCLVHTRAVLPGECAICAHLLDPV